MFFPNSGRRSLLWTLSAVLLVCGAIALHVTRRHVRFVHAKEPTVSKVLEELDAIEESSLIAKESPVPEIAQVLKREPRLEEFDEKDAQFDRASREWAADIPRHTNPAVARVIRKRLENSISEHFDYRQQKRKEEIELLSQRVDALRLAHFRRQENKSEIVKRRLNELTDPKTNLDWDLSSASFETTDATIPANPLDREINAEPKSGKHIDGTFKPTLTVSPTYQNTPLSVWLEKLESERSPTELIEVVTALQHLSSGIDPKVLVQSTFRMSQMLRANVPFDYRFRQEDGLGMKDLISQIVRLLENVPASVVVEELIATLTSTAEQQPTETFQAAIHDLTSGIGSDSYGSVSQDTTSRVHSKRKALGQAMSQESGRLIEVLLKATQGNEDLDDWMVDCCARILVRSQRKLTDFPDLIPVMERVFANSQSTRIRGVSAVALGQSGLRTPEILAFLQDKFRRLFNEGMGITRDCDFFVAQRCIKQLVPKMPQVRDIPRDELVTSFARLDVSKRAIDIAKCVLLIDELADLGIEAEKALPDLRSMVESSNSEISIPYREVDTFRGSSVSGYPKLRDLLNVAIRQIETSVSQSK